jgi:hypothetical protein
MRSSIDIRVKVGNNKSVTTSIEVECGDEAAERKMKEIGELLVELNSDAMIEVSHMTYSSISDTWMQMASYYADEKRFVKH